jgi:hypothetical protein
MGSVGLVEGTQEAPLVTMPTPVRILAAVLIVALFVWSLAAHHYKDAALVAFVPTYAFATLWWRRRHRLH